MPDVNIASPSAEAISEDVKTQGDGAAQTGEAVQSSPSSIQAGDKTDPNLLLESLKKEREKRRKLEEELESLKSSVPSETVESEGEYVSKSEFNELKSKLTKAEILTTYPTLKEIWEEFDEFRSNPENKGMNMKTAAKAFLVEKGLLESTRKGLEKTTGGTRTPISTGLSAEDAERLMKTNYKEYYRRLKEGKLKIE